MRRECRGPARDVALVGAQQDGGLARGEYLPQILIRDGPAVVQHHEARTILAVWPQDDGAVLDLAAQQRNDSAHQGPQTGRVFILPQASQQSRQGVTQTPFGLILKTFDDRIEDPAGGLSPESGDLILAGYPFEPEHDVAGSRGPLAAAVSAVANTCTSIADVLPAPVGAAIWSGHRPFSSTLPSSRSCHRNGLWPPFTAAKNSAKFPRSTRTSWFT